MYDPRRVGLGQPLGDLGGEGKHLLGREGALVQELSESPSLHELHHDVVGALVLPDVEDRRDVRVVQGRGGVGLPFEATSSLGVGGKLRRKDLDRDCALEAGVLRLQDLTHTPRPDGREDLVGSEHAARRERHRLPPRSTGAPSGGYYVLSGARGHLTKIGPGAGRP